MKKLIIFAITLSAYVTASYAQVSATATATATIVTPIAIANATDMNFGNVAVNTSLGTVVLPAAAVPVRTVTGGVTLPATAGTVSAASFTVTGTSGYTYVITLPGGATTIDDNAAHTMTVDTWTSSPSGTGTLTGGTETLYVGATLNVGASQVAGTYSSDTPFTVTVNYN